MRTKTLLLTAALSAAGLATSMAQVYSVNAVGYVNQSVPANGLAILSVPLNGTNNALNTTMPIPNGYDGTTVYRFDVATQNYLDPIAWIEGFGWFSPSDANPTVNPGEGVWVQNLAATALPITFVGEVPSGTLNNAIPGGNNLKLASSVVPKGLPLGDVATAGTTLGFPAADSDTVFIFNPATQNYKDPYAYIDGFGWFSANADDPGPGGPVIQPGTGFWSQKPGAAGTWTQTFSVN
jgi:hypothetical protein